MNSVGGSVGVMILKDGKVLLGKRLEKDGSFSWSMPGGKMEVGESFEDCAKREVLEETSLVLNEVSVFCLNNEAIPSGHFVNVGLLSEDFIGDPQVTEPDKNAEWKWFSLEDLPTLIFLPSKNMIRNYRERKFYIPGSNIPKK